MLIIDLEYNRLGYFIPGLFMLLLVRLSSFCIPTPRPENMKDIFDS